MKYSPYMNNYKIYNLILSIYEIFSIYEKFSILSWKDRIFSIYEKFSILSWKDTS